MSNSLHIKLERPEALDSKRKLLQLEESTLKNISHLKNLQILKRREHTLKKQIKRNVAEIKNQIILLELSLPEEDIKELPKGYKAGIAKIKLYPHEKKESFSEEISSSKKTKSVSKDSSIEKQLAEIREKLASLD